MQPLRKRILIVDPHEEVLISLERLFEDAGYNTCTVWSGQEALSCLRTGHFDLVLISDYLPDFECDSLLREVAACSDSTRCVVMQPCAAGLTDNEHLLSLGAAAVVCKYDLSDMLGTVRQMVSAGLSLSRENDRKVISRSA